MKPGSENEGTAGEEEEEGLGDKDILSTGTFQPLQKGRLNIKKEHKVDFKLKLDSFG